MANQENGDDSCVWTISIEVNGAEVSEDESDCQDDGTELTKRTHNLATSVELSSWRYYWNQPGIRGMGRYQNLLR